MINKVLEKLGKELTSKLAKKEKLALEIEEQSKVLEGLKSGVGPIGDDIKYLAVAINELNIANVNVFKEGDYVHLTDEGVVHNTAGTGRVF